MAGVGASMLAVPAAHARSTIHRRLQTYADPAPATHVVKPAVDAFNQAADGEMETELFHAGLPPISGPALKLDFGAG